MVHIRGCRPPRVHVTADTRGDARGNSQAGRRHDSGAAGMEQRCATTAQPEAPTVQCQRSGRLSGFCGVRRSRAPGDGRRLPRAHDRHRRRAPCGRRPRAAATTTSRVQPNSDPSSPRSVGGIPGRSAAFRKCPSGRSGTSPTCRASFVLKRRARRRRRHGSTAAWRTRRFVRCARRTPARRSSLASSSPLRPVPARGRCVSSARGCASTSATGLCADAPREGRVASCPEDGRGRTCDPRLHATDLQVPTERRRGHALRDQAHGASAWTSRPAPAGSRRTCPSTTPSSASRRTRRIRFRAEAWDARRR